MQMSLLGHSALIQVGVQICDVTVMKLGGTSSRVPHSVSSAVQSKFLLHTGCLKISKLSLAANRLLTAQVVFFQANFIVYLLSELNHVFIHH